MPRIPTRDKRWLVFFWIALFSLSANSQTTLYTYQSGSWDNIDVWTTDPGGTTLVGSKIPEDGDAIVILPSRTLTLPGDITNSGLSITIHSGGTFNAASHSFTNPLTSLSGQGIYKLSSEDFPSAGSNSFVNSNGGTVEYYNDVNISLPATQASYNNLRINCPGFIVTQLTNITINRSFTIQSGTYRINDGTAARRALTVYGDLEVNTGAFLTIGSGSTVSTTDPNATGTGGSAPFLDYYDAQSHRLEIYGNLLNNGTVKFTNQDYPVFNAFPSNGFASVFFRGAADKTITCNGTTDFYNLIVDKGTDQTFVLAVNSAGYDKFRIFGANTAGEFAGGDASDPNIRKALWIRNGTLRLNGFSFIPSLSEGGGNFFIPGNGALVIGGPDVIVMGTIDDYSVVNLAYNVNGGSGAVNGVTTEPAATLSSLALYGKLQVNEGRLYLGEIGRIIYYGTAAAQFIINGGIIDIKQFQSVTGGGKTAYWQTGGNLILRGRFKRTLQYSGLSNLIASIGDPSRLNTARATSDGFIPLGTDPDVGTLNIDQDANIFHMENGTIDIYDVTGSSGTPRAIEINSEPANVSVTGGSISIYITSGTVLTDAPYGIASKAPLNNLNIIRNSGIQSAALLPIPAKPGVTDEASPPLRILNDITLINNTGSANTVLHTSGFNVMTGGDFSIQANSVFTPGDSRIILNGSGNQNFTNSGTITNGLYRFVIVKNAGTATLGSNFIVRDSLVILGGTLNDGGYTLEVAGNVYNAGIHSGNGKIIFNGSNRQYIEATSSALFGNIVLNSTYSTSPYLALTLNTDVSVRSARLGGTRGVFYLVDKRLTIREQGIFLGNNGTNYSATKMFMTDGSHSAKGLNLFLSLTGNLNTNIDTIPLGVYHSGTTAWYTPTIINVNGDLGASVYAGTVNITPVDSPHPSNKNSGDVLAFYWKTIATGTLSSVTPGFVTFRYYNGHISAPSGSKHYYLELGSSEWIMGDIYSDPLVFNQGFMSGAFTAGKNNPFNGPLICRTVSSGFWDAGTTWAPRIPLAYDYVVIGGNGSVNHTVTIRTNNVTCGGVSVWANGLEGDVPKPTLVVNAGLTGLNFTTVAGGGRFILKGSSFVNMPGGDFDFFCNNDTAIFEYNDDGAAGSNYSIPAGIKTYPSLHITSSQINLTKTLPDDGITVLKNLRLFSSFTGNKLSFNNSGNAHHLTVMGDLELRDASAIEVPVASGIKTINVFGNINFTYGNTNHVNAITAADGAGVSHILNFYGTNIYSGASNLTFNNAGANKIDLYFKGAGTSVVSYGTGSFTLNRLILQKDVVSDTVYFRNNFTLNETDNSTFLKSLELNTGILVLSDPSNNTASIINLNLSSGGTNCFIINSSSGIIVRNGSRINISGNTSGSGIMLDGLLQAEGVSEINFADGAGNTGYIEYSGSGNATIVLAGSAVLKAAQVRRSLLLTTGLVNYTQSGSSTATIYGLGTAGIIDPSRAKLEVTGTGSSFTMSGTSSLTILSGGGTSFGDLFLRPGSSTVTGGTIYFGTGTTGQVYKIDADIPLNSLTINAPGAANEIQLMVNPLELSGDLNIADANSRFTSNNIDITIGGKLTVNGTYTAGTNTTLFNGANQFITGSNDITFNNLTVSSLVKLTLNRHISIGSNLNITSGTLDTETFDITVHGNVANNGIFTSDPSGTNKLYLNGTSLQTISGAGSFGRIELDNPAGGARLGNDLILSEDITLTNGVLDINQYSLTLGVESDITPLAFGTGRMIKSDGVFSNGGIIKHFGAGFTGTFVYPSGVSGKYTPATLTIDATNPGWVRINVINHKDPAIVSPFHVLRYFWDVNSSISGFEGSLTLKYDATDVDGNEDEYVAGRLIFPPGTGWSKAAPGSVTDNVDEISHRVFFSYPAGSSNLGGQYTAGHAHDLPDNIPVYTSNTTFGNWNDPSSWFPAPPSLGPDGAIVIIREGDTIFAGGNKRFAFKIYINGTLNVGTSYGHNLGTVEGTGILSLSMANLPAGNFRSFLGCDGGTLEYYGGSYTIVADRIDTVKNLVFKGTGTKTLPDKDLVICNRLEIDGPILENQFNRELFIGGSFLLTSGGFMSGTGAGATVIFNGTSAQTLSGFRSANPLNNFEINNGYGLILQSAIMMKGDLLLTNGVITTTADSLLKMIGPTASASPGSTTSYVDGPMSKNQLGGIDFVFPVGKGGRSGRLGLINPNTGVWQAEYYNSAYPDATVTGSLMNASTTEYWRLNSPASGKTAAVQLRWDSQSDISPVTTTGGINDIVVAEYDGVDWREKASAVPAGNDTDGTVQTSSNIPVSNTGHPGYYTLGSVSLVKPTITPGISAPVCRCVTTGSLPYISVSGGPDQYTINFNTAANIEGFIDVTAWTSLPAGAVPITIPASADPGVYNGTIRVRALATPTNISIPYSFSIIILPDISWTGSNGTDWNDSGNWSCPFQPDLTMPVLIPSVLNKPVINSGLTGSVNNLTISAGSSLSVSGILRISGTITNNGSLNASSGEIELNGNAAQLIPANVFDGNNVKNLTVNNIAGAVLQGPLGVSGVVRLQTGILSSAGNLTLLSTVTGTALIDGSGSGDVTGNVTMQRYLPSGFGYKYFSSPFQAATVSQFGDEVDLGNWFPLIYAFDENRYYLTTPLEPFYKYVTPSNVLNPMEGYAINFGADLSPVTVDVTGVVNNGVFSRTLYNHNHPYSLGRNLIGNPYPSPIDWTSALGWTKTNIDSAVYYFNAGITDEWEGSYSSWVNGVSSNGIASNIIPSMQGFMVRVSTGSYPVTGTLTMDNRVRVINTTQAFSKKSLMGDQKPLVRISASFSNYYPSGDPLVIYFDEKATRNFDQQFDAVKYVNTDHTVPNFFSFSNDGSKLSINAIPLPEGLVPTIPLGYKSDYDGEVVFRLKNIEGPYSWETINIYDAVTGESRDLASGTEYRVSLPAGEYTNRFYLNFDGFATGNNRIEPYDTPFKVFSSNGSVFAEVFMLTENEGTLSILSITGQKVYVEKIYSNGRYEIDPNLKDGIYIVTLTSGNRRISEKVVINNR